MTTGVMFKDVYLGARDFVFKRQPALIDYFAQHVGFVMGLQVHDTHKMLSEDCHSEQLEEEVVDEGVDGGVVLNHDELVQRMRDA